MDFHGFSISTYVNLLWSDTVNHHPNHPIVVIHAVCMQFLSAYKCDFSEQSFLVGYAWCDWLLVSSSPNISKCWEFLDSVSWNIWNPQLWHRNHLLTKSTSCTGVVLVAFDCIRLVTQFSWLPHVLFIFHQIQPAFPAYPGLPCPVHGPLRASRHVESATAHESPAASPSHVARPGHGWYNPVTGFMTLDL